MAAKNREFPNPGVLSTNLTVGQLRPQVTLYKYRVYMKKSPNFLTLEMAPLSTLMPLHEQHREGMVKMNQTNLDPVESMTYNDITDLVNPNVETNFNSSGRIDARRPEFAIRKWTEANRKMAEWMEHQKGAEFVRNTPLTMINHYKGFDYGTQSMLQPDQCTDTELVYLHYTGSFHRIHTGVRHENWMNRWKIVPLAGGSRKWSRKISFFNKLGIASVAIGAVLNLLPIWGLIWLPMGTKCTLAAILPVAPVLYVSGWLATHVIAAVMYYFQYVNPIVKALWWEPDTRTLCVELVNFMAWRNLEKRVIRTRDEPTLIKIPQKFCSSKYTVDERDSFIQFDLAHDDTGGNAGALPMNTNHYLDHNLENERTRHGKCIVLKSMPLVEGAGEECLPHLEPFDILLDFLTERVQNANPEMCPEIDFSDETVKEFYEDEDFKFGPSRWEFERRTINYTV